MQPDIDPFVIRLPPGQERPGPLAGVRVAVKDNFDVAGLVTGLGNPDWARSHPVAVRDARAVELLRTAGAAIAGKAHTDEFAYSLAGENSHFGILENPTAPGRVVGGSSSGPAAAVVAGLAELGLGSDTAGSIRVPASYCGLFGLRPTWGSVPVDGLVPMATSFDTVGLLARDVVTLRAGFEALTGADAAHTAEPGADLKRAVLPSLGLTPAQDAVERVLSVLGAGDPAAVDVEVAIGVDWIDAFTVVQGAEFWAAHGSWITEHRPKFTAAVAQRVAFAARVDDDQRRVARQRLDTVSDRIRALVGDDLLILPTTPGPAPLRGQAPGALREQTLRLTTLASITGLPALSIPVTAAGRPPLGVSIIGPPDAEPRLLALAAGREFRVD